MGYHFNKSTVEKISWSKGEPSWMTELRLRAWDVCAKKMPALEGMDLNKLQAYLDPARTTVPSHEWPEDLQEALDERGDEEGLIVQRDASIQSRSISKEQVRKGVVFIDLDTAVKSSPDLIQRYFAQQATPDDAWSALHTAFWSGGSFLYVPPHVDVELPFHTCYWSSIPGSTQFPYTIIVAEAGSRVSFMDDHVAGLSDETSLSVEMIDLWVREKAQVFYYDRQNTIPTVRHLRMQKNLVARSGRLLSFRAEMGGPLEDRRLTLDRFDGDAKQSWTAKTQQKYLSNIEAVFAQLPDEPLREKLRQYVEGKMSGLRPPLTLESIAAWHPEIRL